MRVSKGVARWTDEFAPPAHAYPIPDFHAAVDADTKLLLHLDGTDTSTSTDDFSESNHAITFGGSAEISTDQAKFGVSSLKSSATGDRVTMPSSSDFSVPLNGDFTFECWMYPPASKNAQVFRLNNDNETDASNFRLEYENSSNRFYVYYGTSLSYFTGSSITTGVWTHVAVVRHGGV